MPNSSIKRLMRFREASARVGYARSSIYRKMEAGLFPKARPIGPGSVRWLESEINEWIQVHATKPNRLGLLHQRDE